MIPALILIVLFAALIGASILAARHDNAEDADHPPANAKAEERVAEDQIAEPFPR